MLQKRWPWVVFIIVILAVASLQVLLTSEEHTDNTLLTNIPDDVRPQATASGLPQSSAWGPPRSTGVPATPLDTCELNKSVVYDDLTITFLDIVESSGSSRVRPRAGHVFIQPLFRLENNSDHDFAISSVLSFAVFIDGKSVGESYLSLQGLQVRKLDGTIAPGKSMEGALAVQAPEDWEMIEIHFRPTIQSDKITFQCRNSRKTQASGSD